MAVNIPSGWVRVRGERILKGDRIKTADGWSDAENIAKPVSAVGHPSALYEMVIRKEKKGK